jgi:hypothetical protein
MAIYKNTPPIVTSGLVTYLDAANRQTVPFAGSAEVVRGFSNISNGTSTLVTSSLLADNTDGPCFKLATNEYITPSVLVQNSDYPCLGNSLFQVFVKPDPYAYVKLRDGATTNLQVDFDLVNGTILGGNNASSGSITPYSNGWYLLSMQINRTTPFNYGTRIGVYPTSASIGNTYTSSLGQGVLTYMPRVFTLSTSSLRDLSGVNNPGQLLSNTTASNNAFIFNGTSNYISVGANISETFFSELTLDTTIFLGETFTTSSSTRSIFSTFLDTNNRALLYFSADSGQRGKLIFTSIRAGTLSTYFTSVQDNWPAGTYNITVAITNGEGRMYINGVQIPTVGATSLPSNFGYLVKSSNILVLGANFFNNIRQFFLGSIYYIKIYNRSLTSREIQQNYNATKTRFNLT